MNSDIEPYLQKFQRPRSNVEMTKTNGPSNPSGFEHENYAINFA